LAAVLQLQRSPEKQGGQEMMVFLKKLHKWVGLLIGLQVLLWLLSGLMISLLDPLKVSGKQWATSPVPEPGPLQTGVLLEPGELPARHLNGARSISLTSSRGQPVYHIKHSGGETLINAVDGSVIVTSKVDAENLARQDFFGDGEIISVEHGTAPDMETRNSTGEYWRVNFSDKANTALYISLSSGEILERRNSYWRVRDFFWMLHIMDYSGRENFNNVLIIVVALIAIWIGISGFILLFSSFNRHDFYFLNVFGKRDDVVITLIDPAGTVPRQVSLRKGSNLFLSLATHNIKLPSICGGGGECGQCRVKMETADLPAATAIEQGLIPRRLREQGFRLACQQEVKSNITLRLKA
jgi:Na+-transporting NADH:ubiquinone oxidoreductase subunit F